MHRKSRRAVYSRLSLCAPRGTEVDVLGARSAPWPPPALGGRTVCERLNSPQGQRLAHALRQWDLHLEKRAARLFGDGARLGSADIVIETADGNILLACLVDGPCSYAHQRVLPLAVAADIVQQTARDAVTVRAYAICAEAQGIRRVDVPLEAALEAVRRARGP